MLIKLENKMSTIRNPRKFDVNKSDPNVINAKEINNSIDNIENLVKQHRYYNRKVRNEIIDKVEMFKYLIEHPKLHWKINIDKKVDKVQNIIEQVPNLKVDVSDLKTYKVVK